MNAKQQLVAFAGIALVAFHFWFGAQRPALAVLYQGKSKARPATPDHAGRDANGNLVPYYDGTPGHQLPLIPGVTPGPPQKPVPSNGQYDGTPGHQLPTIPGLTP